MWTPSLGRGSKHDGHGQAGCTFPGGRRKVHSAVLRKRGRPLRRQVLAAHAHNFKSSLKAQFQDRGAHGATCNERRGTNPRRPLLASKACAGCTFCSPYRCERFRDTRSWRTPSRHQSQIAAPLAEVRRSAPAPAAGAWASDRHPRKAEPSAAPCARGGFRHLLGGFGKRPALCVLREPRGAPPPLTAAFAYSS